MQALRGVADPLRTIAIVGNGPITAYQRQQIEAADAIIRFNKLDNWCGTQLMQQWSAHEAQPAPVSPTHGRTASQFCVVARGVTQFAGAQWPSADLAYRDSGLC